MRFTKMHGLGNDYLYVYGDVPEDAAARSVRLSERHFGVGSDGMIYISPSDIADFKMRIFNADGSEAMMCGNGIRCVGKYVYDKGYTDKTQLTIETLSGVKKMKLHVETGEVRGVTVDMGLATIGPDKHVDIDSTLIFCTPVTIGNPHAVLFTEDAEKAPVTALGSLLERHSSFPGGVNVEFVQVLSETVLRMRVWERGSGVTMACGTGACASVAAAAAKGFCRYDTPISVQLDGGALIVQVSSNGRIAMTGPAELVYEGEVFL